MILSGTATLVDNAGEHPLNAGDVAVFRQGEADAHHLRNLGNTPCVVFAVSLPERSTVHYPDIAMRWSPEDGYTAD